MEMMLLNMAISDEMGYILFGAYFVITVGVCLWLTLLTELPVALLATRQPRFMTYSIICNIVTNPPLNIAGLLLLEFYGRPAYTCFIAAGEIAVLLIETAMYYFLDKKKTPIFHCFLLSLACNAVSFLTGLGLSAILGMFSH